MSDSVYRQQAERRTRRIWTAAAIILIPTCLVLFIASLYRDTCTGSFERSPEAVLQSFVSGVSGGDTRQVLRCWERSAYYDMESGCSEICLERIIGIPYRLTDLELSESFPEDGRSRISAEVTISCPDSGELHTGQVILDTVAMSVPWRHWKIIHSSFGGPLAEPWCK